MKIILEPCKDCLNKPVDEIVESLECNFCDVPYPILNREIEISKLIYRK